MRPWFWGLVLPETNIDTQQTTKSSFAFLALLRRGSQTSLGRMIFCPPSDCDDSKSAQRRTKIRMLGTKCQRDMYAGYEKSYKTVARKLKE